jgi:predicted extracellular nuclease
MKLHRLCAFFVGLVGLSTLASLTAAAQAGLVISQVYGGGGNTGAQYTYDYLELYNPTSSSISLAGLSFQYASSTGSSWNAVALPNVSVAAGHYFLIQAAAGTANPGPLPVTPDFVPASAPNFSATTGKIALVNGTAALTGTCPAAGSNIVDFIGYGTATCFLGAGDAQAPSNTTADIRGGFSNNNAADFTVGTPNPHNSSFGSTSTGLSATGQAAPASVTSGNPVLLIVTVTPATNPASTGITVAANLSTIGGSATQPFYDDGTHGDVTAGDNVFSFTVTPTVSKPATLSLPVSVADAESDTAATSISLTVSLPVPDLPIHTIQGSKSQTATSVSPYAGQTVTTEGIVTGVGTAGFFIQARDSDADSDPTTPEGIFVFAGTGKVPATAVIGNYVQVTGTVATFPAVTTSHTPATEIDTTTATVLATGQPLPAPVTIMASMLTPGGGLYQLTPYEGMRVSIASLTTISGTDGSLSSEAAETTKSNGQFYAVITGTPRPFREPGIDIRDSQTGLPPDVAKFDDNPERILVDSSFLVGSAAINLSTGAVLPGVSGILDFTFSSDSFYDPSRLVLDPAYDRTQVVAGMGVQPVPPPASSEFRVAAYNVERFFNTNSADDIDFNPVTGQTEKSQAVDVTPAAYSNRLAKVSLAIRHVLGSPDVVALEEPENESVVADIAAKISADALAAGEPDPQYVPYGTGTSYAPYSNDISGISVGFLVKSTVNTLGIEQLGADTTFPDPRNSATLQTLNDRPPLVLHAGVKRSGATDYPVTVIVNHLRSLSSENDPSSGVFVRTKKELQAEFLANLIQGYQQKGEHVISVGDYNAFEFSDGYIDILGTVTNQNVLPSTQVVEPGVAGLVTPPATDLALLLTPDQRWSYQEFGNAQILDHIVATADLVSAGAHMAYAHLDADQPLTAYNDPTTPARTSDHDAAVGYFNLPAPVLSATLSGNGSFGSQNVNTSSGAQPFVLKNTGEGNISVSIGASGDFSQTNDCGTSLAYGTSCNIYVIFSPTGGGARGGVLTVTSSAGTYTANLSGTGVIPIDAALTVRFERTHLVYPGSTLMSACIASTNGVPATGTIQIYDGATLLATRPVLRNGCAFWYIHPALAAGAHQISVVYSGDKNNPIGASEPTTIVVDPAPVDLDALCGSPILEYGASYHCIADARSHAGPAQGSITYSYDNGTSAAVPLNQGRAEFSISQPTVGSHIVSIGFAQQGNYAAASARIQRFVVLPASVRVALTASSRSAKVGATLTFNATVGSNSAAGAPSATGTITFRDGFTLLATVPVDANGQAVFSTSGLSAGVHMITATYANGANYGTDSSSVTVLISR